MPKGEQSTTYILLCMCVTATARTSAKQGRHRCIDVSSTVSASMWGGFACRCFVCLRFAFRRQLNFGFVSPQENYKEKIIINFMESRFLIFIFLHVSGSCRLACSSPASSSPITRHTRRREQFHVISHISYHTTAVVPRSHDHIITVSSIPPRHKSPIAHLSPQQETETAVYHTHSGNFGAWGVRSAAVGELEEGVVPTADSRQQFRVGVVSYFGRLCLLCSTAVARVLVGSTLYADVVGL